MADKKKNAPDRAGSETGEEREAVAILVLTTKKRQRIVQLLDELQELLGFLR